MSLGGRPITLIMSLKLISISSLVCSFAFLLFVSLKKLSASSLALSNRLAYLVSLMNLAVALRHR